LSATASSEIHLRERQRLLSCGSAGMLSLGESTNVLRVLVLAGVVGLEAFH
jgi:hypothetical protein